MRSLAASYLKKATVRARALSLYMDAEDYSDVVREAQEVVELSLKEALRLIGVEPPKIHEVSPLLREYADRLHGLPLQEIGEISARLRRDREMSFYGDVDFLPDEQYTRDDAQRALDGALRTLAEVTSLARRIEANPILSVTPAGGLVGGKTRLGGRVLGHGPALSQDDRRGTSSAKV